MSNEREVSGERNVNGQKEVSDERKVNGQKEVSGKRRENLKKNIVKLFKVLWKIIENLAIIAITIISLIILTQKISDNEKSFFGYKLFRVQTGSMAPAYNVGDVILVKEKNPDDISIGEDITYWGTAGTMKGKLVTHRVIDIVVEDGKKVFRTKGIANTSDDPKVYAEQINGVVQGKLYITTIICTFLNNKYIFYFCVVMPITIMIFFSFLKGNFRKMNGYR